MNKITINNPEITINPELLKTLSPSEQAINSLQPSNHLTETIATQNPNILQKQLINPDLNEMFTTQDPKEQKEEDKEITIVLTSEILKEFRIKSNIARNPFISTNELESLLTDPNPIVRKIATENPNITDEQLERATKDKSPDVMATAYTHPKIKEKQITKFFSKKSTSNNDSFSTLIKTVIISKRTLTREQLNLSLEDLDYEVRMESLKQPLITHDDLNKALLDSSMAVRNMAKAVLVEKITRSLTQPNKQNFKHKI
jgi:hypothetical protein